MPAPTSIYETAAVDRIRAELKFDPRRLRALRTAFFKKFLGAEAAVDELPAEVREEFAARVQFHPLSIAEARDSEIDGATKLVLRTSAGYMIETVIMRTGTGRVSLCLSSQVGCAAACGFCATGQMGVAKSLSTSEILDQIVLANERLQAEQRKARNIVFMGMGEPFHNEAAVYDAVHSLLSPELFHHASRYILISTVGIPDAMTRCARRFPNINLALSLHSARQGVRERLIPLAAKFKLDELRVAVAQVNQIQQNTVMIEYLMLAGVNDSAADARELAAWLDGLNVHVNLIPYNPISATPALRTTERSERDAFASIVRDAGFVTTIRYSLGADIAAACGQLVQSENLAIARQQAAASVN
ncbi:MAG TPA: 23S rRNA (adenine(2503)-C(2))-methyltransferase RlmN [Lacipirellulaceae bacterium]|jgi:23S rRNA (adenine2503-C2)-methyltransferase|nr:23S rRNA (adenine(2503)-C(2))-methyltransferase RlmN [Lacipirellulaceae bacterium]